MYTDDEYARRFSAKPSDVAARTFAKEIAYTMFEALVEKGFQVAFNRSDELEWLNVHVYPQVTLGHIAAVTDIQMPGSMDGLKLAHAVHDRWRAAIAELHAIVGMRCAENGFTQRERCRHPLARSKSLGDR